MDAAHYAIDLTRCFSILNLVVYEEIQTIRCGLYKRTYRIFKTECARPKCLKQKRTSRCVPQIQIQNQYPNRR